MPGDIDNSNTVSCEEVNRRYAALRKAHFAHLQINRGLAGRAK